MKNYCSLISAIMCIFFVNSINAQLTQTEIVSGVNVKGFALNGNDLYFSNGITGVSGKISKIDISGEASIIPIDIVTGLQTVDDILIIGDYLYIIERIIDESKIYKIDITDSSYSLIDVVTLSERAYSMAVIGNDLYIGTNNGIRRVDITSPNPVASEFLNIDYVNILTANGNELYYPSSEGISKSDVTSTTPTVTFVTSSSLIGGLTFKGNDLFISQVSVDVIAKLDTTASVITVEDYYEFSDYTNGGSLIFSGDDLYIFEANWGRISRISNSTLSTTTFSKDNITIYPNPTRGVINIRNLKGDIEATLCDVNGKLVFEKSLVVDQINLEFLPKGIYLLELKNKEGVSITKKIIKD